MKSNYNHFRPQIKTGDLILFAAKDIISRIIAWKTKSPISHAAMACWITNPIGELRLYLLESVLFGVTPSYLSNRLAWYLPHGDIYWHPMKQEWSEHGDAAAARLMDQVGKYYDYQDLILQAVKRVTLDPAKMYCSEAVLYGWADIIGWNKDQPVPYPSEVCEAMGVHQKHGELLIL